MKQPWPVVLEKTLISVCSSLLTVDNAAFDGNMCLLYRRGSVALSKRRLQLPSPPFIQVVNILVCV